MGHADQRDLLLTNVRADVGVAVAGGAVVALGCLRERHVRAVQRLHGQQLPIADVHGGVRGALQIDQ